MFWNATLTNLRYVLADLYFLKEDSIPVARDAGLNPAIIPFKDKATNNWSEILDIASKLGKVPNIIQVALRDYPNNQYLLSAQNGTLTPIKPIIDDEFTWKSREVSETLERLMDEQSTLLPISWLDVGLQRSKSIGKVRRIDHTYGTGFLLQENLFITNHHVLSTRDEAQSAIVQFNYQNDAAGRACEPVNFELDPSSCFRTSTENDWTLVRVKGEANGDWGAIDLKPVEIRLKDYANIIQHPGGEAKQIALYHNILTYVDDTYVQYLTDTLPGSSGSAVFDSQWRLIAIHHSGGWLTEPITRKRVYRNEGINVNCVLRDFASLGLVL